MAIVKSFHQRTGESSGDSMLEVEQHGAWPWVGLTRRCCDEQAQSSSNYCSQDVKMDNGRLAILSIQERVVHFRGSLYNPFLLAAYS